MISRLRVLVTGVGGGSVGAQITKALALDESFFVVTANAGAGGLPTTWSAETVTLPHAESNDYLEVLLSVVQKLRLKAVLPGSEAETIVLSKPAAKRALESCGVYVAVNSHDVVAVGSDQAATTEAVVSAGLAAPRHRVVDVLEEIDAVDFLPAVVKPRTGSGSRGVAIAQDATELSCVVRMLIARGETCVVQEYVGTPDLEFTAGFVSSQEGTELSRIAMRRELSGLGLMLSVPNRSGREDLGPSLKISSGLSHGSFDRFVEVEEAAASVSAYLQATCAINIQCRLVDGDPIIFEVNPRFSGSTSLRALAGVNEPARLLRWELLGDRSEQPYATTCTVRRHLQEVRLE